MVVGMNVGVGRRRPVVAHALQLVDVLRFVWTDEDSEGHTCLAREGTAWRALRAREQGGWDVLWCDGGPTRRMILPSALDKAAAQAMLVRWHVNRADLARDGQGRVPDTVRTWLGVGVEVEEGALSRRCSVLLRRPVPAGWALADALEAIPARSTAVR